MNIFTFPNRRFKLPDQSSLLGSRGEYEAQFRCLSCERRRQAHARGRKLNYFALIKSPSNFVASESSTQESNRGATKCEKRLWSHRRCYSRGGGEEEEEEEENEGMV